MNKPHRATWTVLFLASLMASPLSSHGAEPLETVRDAFRASSMGITSGIGKGTFQAYEAAAGGDWQLRTDAHIETSFNGVKYRVALTFNREPSGRTSQVIIYDGEAVTAARFSPLIRPTGASAEIFRPENRGNGISKPQMANFPWDVSRLSWNVFNFDRLIKNIPPDRLEIHATPDGDLIGSYSDGKSKGARVKFECPKKFGFNIASKQVYNGNDATPVQESRIEWKQSLKGLWYVTLLEETFVFGEDKRRLRELIRYTDFLPNVPIPEALFTEASLKMPVGTRVIDRRKNADVRIPKNH